MENSYICKKTVSAGFPSYDNKVWDIAPPVFLVDVITGKSPKLKTEFKMIYTDDAVHLRFICEDDYIVSEFSKRDDPIYKNDVVEFFVAESNIYHYLEFEQSPKNVLFDAEVIFHDSENIEVKTEWNAEDWQTFSFFDTENRTMYYEWKLPFRSMGFKIPEKSSAWRFNVYRIDREKNNADEFTAFSATGKCNFHIPEAFSVLLFD